MTLSRQDMERVIREGGSVLHGGELYTRIDRLPTEADLAKGNPAQEAAVSANLQAQIDALKAQLDQVQPTKAPAQSSGTPVYDATSEALSGAGFDSRDAVQAASDEDLLAVPGIGPATLKKLRTELEA